MINMTSNELVSECSEVFEHALASISYLKDRASTDEERKLLKVMELEGIAFFSMKNLLIDSDEMKFLNDSTLEVVTSSIINFAVSIFAGSFPLLRWKAFNLVIALREARLEMCLQHKEINGRVCH